MNHPLKRKDLLIICVVGVIAATVNLFRLPLFFESEFVFGPALVLLVAVFRGPWVGLLTSAIASLPLAMAWGSFWSTLTFGLEAWVVGYICAHKKINVMLVVIFYWLFIGMPISWYAISSYGQVLDSHRTSILIKQLTNGILYAHVTALLLYLPKIRKLLRRNVKQHMFSIKEQSSYVISILLITVGILFFFYAFNLTIKNSSDKFSIEHQMRHNSLATSMNLFLTRKISVLNEFKYTLASVWDNENRRAEFLLQFNSRYPEFKTMLVADAQANLIHSSPAALVANVKAQNESINISDRDYFKSAINSDEVYVSPGFIGRGFGNSIISAVSVGIPDLSNESQNVGVLEGSFILDSLNEFQRFVDVVGGDVVGLLLDQDGNVLLSSEGLVLKSLEPIEMQHVAASVYQNDLVSIKQDDSKDLENTYYYYGETQFDWNWKLITLQNESRYATVVEKTLVYFAIAIVLMVLIAELLAHLISHRWSYSMQKLNQMVESDEGFNGEITDFENNERLPAEVINLFHEIKNSRQEIESINKSLQDTVAERTEKLHLANIQLNKMARQDSLTQLENRRVFTETLNDLWAASQNNLQVLSMLIIDVDNFKKVNDTYGHPAGDAVLIQLAEALKTFKKPSIKSLSRLGGEEFCLLLVDCEHPDAEQLAEDIRHTIEQKTFLIGTDKRIHITISIGLASINATKYTADKLYQAADSALYEAKDAGRNAVKGVMLL